MVGCSHAIGALEPAFASEIPIMAALMLIPAALPAGIFSVPPLVVLPVARAPVQVVECVWPGSERL